jgi:hypothetical protein
MSWKSTRVAEVRAHIGSSLDKLLQTLIPLVAYYDGALHALAFGDMRGAIETEDDLRHALVLAAPSLPEPERALAASREAESLGQLRDALGLDYGLFNAALRSLQPEYEPILNYERHAQAMAHYIQVSRSRLLQELRVRYLDAFRAGASLDSYVDARELEISPDPAWLYAFDLPSDEMIQARISAWLENHGTVSHQPAELPEIDQVRAHNHALIARIADSAARLVPAWARRYGRRLPSAWTDAAASDTVLSRASKSGYLDFELLSQARAIAWLAAQDLWPDGMPRSLAPGELGLNDADLQTEADIQERDRRERLRQRRVIHVDGIEFSAEPGDYTAIFDHVSATISDDVLATSRPARLLELPETRTSQSSGKRGPTGARQESMSDAQKMALGLVGETIAFAWLQRRYPDICSPASWVSSYREAIGEPPGDNSLGYDFKIALKQTTLYFE